MKAIALVSFVLAALPAWANEIPLENAQVDTSIVAIGRGAEQLIEGCRGCHSLKYIRYRDLAGLGIDQQKIDAWRGDQTLDAPLTSQMPDDAAMQSYGKVPPDLSLMTKARAGGADYVYSYLIGYYTTQEGLPSNHVFPETKMPDILGMSGAVDAAQQGEIKAKARDIVSFLNWAADPHENERHQLGYYVLGYLFVLTALLYVVKNRVWAKLK